MCHTTLLDSKFLDFLVRTDEKMAEEVRAGRCLRCGSALHLNSFPRKPRGMPLEWTEHFTYRLSFDCSVCSKRHTPRSVRFLEHRVYIAFAVVLSCAVQTGLTDFREKVLLKWVQALRPRRNVFTSGARSSPGVCRMRPDLVNLSLKFG